VVCTDAELTHDISYQDIKIRVKVENEGSYNTDEVIEIYSKAEESVYEVPNYKLCGFRRVSLKAGEKQELEIAIPLYALQIVDDNGERRIDGKSFVFYVGVSQPDTRSQALTGKKPLKICFNIE
jgi:beta-glucosidase